MVVAAGGTCGASMAKTSVPFEESSKTRASNLPSRIFLLTGGSRTAVCCCCCCCCCCCVGLLGLFLLGGVGPARGLLLLRRGAAHPVAPFRPASARAFFTARAPAPATLAASAAGSSRRAHRRQRRRDDDARATGAGAIVPTRSLSLDPFLARANVLCARVGRTPVPS